MKDITREWLKASADDLAAARHLLSMPELTNLVAFHAQQCLEKALKAILEEKNAPNIKSHDLIRLNNLIKEFLLLPDLQTLKFLNELYVDSRYPGDMGLLPSGKPSHNEAKVLIEYANLVHYMILNYLETG
jgi:HEPN domain-containing protein